MNFDPVTRLEIAKLLECVVVLSALTLATVGAGAVGNRKKGRMRWGVCGGTGCRNDSFRADYFSLLKYFLLRWTLLVSPMKKCLWGDEKLRRAIVLGHNWNVSARAWLTDVSEQASQSLSRFRSASLHVGIIASRRPHAKPFLFYSPYRSSFPTGKWSGTQVLHFECKYGDWLMENQHTWHNDRCYASVEESIWILLKLLWDTLLNLCTKLLF